MTLLTAPYKLYEGLRKPRIKKSTARINRIHLRGVTKKSSIESDHAALQTKIIEERKAAEDKLKLLEQAEAKLTKEFENLANRIFEEKHEK